MIDNWLEWHRHYDTPNSPLAQRLMMTQREFRRTLALAPSDARGLVQVVSICAGEGRDVLPVLANGHERHVKALLLELDEEVAERTRRNISYLQISNVELRIADAGLIDSFTDALPVHVMVASGVFGNISMADTRRTIAALPFVLAPCGHVVWTRSRRLNGSDRSSDIRAIFGEHGFTEVSFATTSDGTFCVSVHQLAAEPGDLAKLHGSRRLFSFKSDPRLKSN